MASAFVSLFFRCYIAFILIKWKGNSPTMVGAISGMDDPPVNVMAMILSNTSIRITWEPPALAREGKGIITYNVSYGASQNYFNEISNLTNDTIIELDNLQPGNQYFITVEAVYDGITCGSVQLNATTAITPDSVMNVSILAENVTSSTVTVNWMEVNDQTDFNISYRVFYRPVSGPYDHLVNGEKRRRQLGQELIFMMDFTDPPGTLTNLNGSVTYRIQVVAIARAQYSSQELIGDRSEPPIPVNTTVGTPTIPRQLNGSMHTKNRIVITWQRPEPPNGLIQFYIVSYTASLEFFDQEDGRVKPFTSNDAKNISAINESSLNFSINITDLRVGTAYVVSVVGHTIAGPGVSAFITVSTLPDAPPKPHVPQVSKTTGTTAIIEIQQASSVNGPIRYFAVIVAIGSNASIANSDIDSYSEAAANQALNNGRPYVYIAGLVMVTDIKDYPHVFMLGDGSMSSNGGVNYVNVPLQANTQYAVAIRAYTADDLFADSAPVIVTTTALPAEDTEDEISLAIIVGAAVGGAFVIIVLIIIVVWPLYCCLHKRNNSPCKESDSIDYSNGVVLQNIMHSPDAGFVKAKTSVVSILPEDNYVGIEGKLFTFPSFWANAHRQTSDLKIFWSLNGKDVSESTSSKVGTNGQLTIESVSKDHEGEWTCQVNNTFGNNELRFRSNLTMKSFGMNKLKYLPVPVNEYGSHVKQLHANKNRLFDRQFESLYNGEDMSTIIGSKPVNKCKNRFLNIVVYDGNRIALTPFGKYTDEYINASPVDGCEGQKQYIATQAPTNNTLDDFWRLIWQEHPPTIVMVTNLVEREKTKCVKYWPSTIGEYLTIGPYNVLMEEEQMFADYVIRKLQVVKLDSSKYAHTVTQFHFTAWPDHGVPDYATSILMFHSKVISAHKSSDGPMLVHCSAGVGRTGTFVAIDIALKQVQREGVVDIYNTIEKLRYQRPHMVQTLEQYMFIHDAILESISCGNTQINVVNLQKVVNKLKQRDQTTSLTGFEQQLKVLEQVSPKLEDQLCTSGVNNPTRNRPGHNLPVEKFRVILKGETPDYINASYVKGYKQNRSFIVAQSPMENTTRDFWRMILNQHCATIVMLCELVENNQEACTSYWCSSKTVTYKDITVTVIAENQGDNYTRRVFQITDVKTNDSHQATQLHYHGWDAYKTPSSSAGLLEMVEVVQKIQRRTKNKPIVVHCSNAIGRSGTFCVLYTVLEKVKAEKVTDIFQTVKLLRIQRPGVVEDLDQYCFIFSAALQFLQSFENYSNFT